MLRTHRRPIGLFVALLMAFTAVWCCCVPVRAASTHRPSCCEERPSCPVDKMPADGCPIIQVRESSVAPAPAVLPPGVDLAVALPEFLTPLLVIAVPVTADRPERSTPATGPPTLLALHTSLLW